MDNFKLAVKGVFKRAVEAFQTYPSAMGNALLFAVVAIVRINLEWEVQQEYNLLLSSLQWAMALGSIYSLTVITGANSRYNTTKSFIYSNISGFAVTAVTFILLYFFGETQLTRDYGYLSEISISRVSAAVVISMIVFIYLASFPKEKSDFSRAFFMTHKAFFISVLYGLVLFSGTSGVAGAIQALLYNDMSNKVFQYIGVIAGFITFSIFIGYFPDFKKEVEDPRRQELQEQPKFVQVLLGSIMVPILLALTLVLLMWTIRTFSSGVGSSFIRLSGIAASYALGGIWLHIMVTDQNSGLVNFFKKVYPFTALIILGFEAWALLVQLGESGLKTVEYNFILVWLFTVFSVVMLIFMREQSHRKIALMGCLFIMVAVLPVIGYHNLPVKYQVNRLETILMDEEILVDGDILPAEVEPSIEVREDITDAVNFLAYKENKNIPKWFDKELNNDQKFKKVFGFNQTWPKYDDVVENVYKSTNVVLSSGVVNIEDYNWAINFKDYYGSEEVSTVINGTRGIYDISWATTNTEVPELIVELDGKIILQETLEDYFDSLIEKYPPGERHLNEAELEELSVKFYTKEVELLLVFENIEIGIDTRNNRKNYWTVISGMFFKEHNENLN